MFAIRLSTMEPTMSDCFYSRGVPDPSIGYFRPYTPDGPLFEWDDDKGNWVRIRREIRDPVERI